LVKQPRAIVKGASLDAIRGATSMLHRVLVLALHREMVMTQTMRVR
jgi:hypothetical protein